MTSHFEESQFRLLDENKALIAECTKLKAELAGYRSRVCSMCDGHGLVGNCMDCTDCPDCTKVINNIKADAVEEAIFKTREAMQEGSPKWLCRVTSLEEYANKIRVKK